MKKFIIFLFFIALNFNNNLLIAHSQYTHQYIVREAYKLLKKQLGQDIPILVDYLGYDEGQTTDWTRDAFDSPYVVAGAWDEDVHDIVWNYDKRVDWVFKSILGDFLSRVFFASISHFYCPDKIVATKNNFLVFELAPWPIPSIWINDRNNAMTKALSYAYGTKGAYDPYTSGITKSYGWQFNFYAGLEDCYHIRYDGIVNLYQSSWYVINKYDIGGNEYPENNYYLSFYEATRKYFSFNILGRLCHLLGDMSVPAHVHVDEHSYGDYYEDKMNIHDNNNFVTVWSSENVFEEKGGYINPYCEENYDPIFYLFWTTAQLADHFASRRNSGDDVFNDNRRSHRAGDGYINHSLDEIKPIIFDDIHSTHPGPTISSNHDYNHSDDDLAAIRDATFPYVIRATAGLMYWFAVEAGLIGNNGCPFDILNVQDQTLSGHNYTFEASDKVNVGNSVTNTIPSGDVIISSTAKNVVFKAVNEIKFSDGFSVENGADMHAYIGPCSNCTSNGTGN